MSCSVVTTGRKSSETMLIKADVQYDAAKIIGDKAFLDTFKEKTENADQNKHQHRPLDGILKAECKEEKDFELIKAGSRKRCFIPVKARYIKEAVKEGYSYREIGRNINITDSAVAVYLK